MKLFTWKRRHNQWNKLWNYKEYLSLSSQETASHPGGNEYLRCLLPACIFLLIVTPLLVWTLQINHSSSSSSFSSSNGPSRQSMKDLNQQPGAWMSSGRHLLSANSVEDTNSNFTEEYVYNVRCQLLKRNVSQDAAHGPAWETCDFERSTEKPALWVALYIMIVLVIFIALAIVCDDFFVPSLEAISEKLHLSEDVAGATFMAAGSSAPELFSSIAAVTFESDVGVGTITGSAVFNLLVIISLTAAFAGKVLTIDWRPLARDSTFYAAAIIWLIYSVWDTEIQLIEAVVMLILYALYILTMVFNTRLMDALASLQNLCCKSLGANGDHCPSDNGLDVDMESRPVNDDDMRRMSTVSQYSNEAKMFRHDRRNSFIQAIATPHHKLLGKDGDDKLPSGGGRKFSKMIPMQPFIEEPESRESTPMRDANEPNAFPKENNNKVLTLQEDEEEEEEGEMDLEEDDPHVSCTWICKSCPPVRGAPPSKEVLEKDLEEQKSSEASPRLALTHWAIFFLKWGIFLLAFPFLVVFSWTIPDCSKEHNRKWFAVSFFTSVVWIAGLSFGMVTVVARTGCLINVDSFVMSLVVLAAGTSIPDLLSSIIVARDGFADMAVSNAIGSNVFDIAMGLGLPFLIRVLINVGRPLNFFSDTERKAYCEGRMILMPHVKFGFILLAILCFAQITFALARFRLSKMIGISFFLTYLLFLVYAFLQEFLCNKPGNYNC